MLLCADITVTSLTLTLSLFIRYKDYRDPPWEPDAYSFSKQYWSVLAAKLAFVIFFQVWILIQKVVSDL